MKGIFFRKIGFFALFVFFFAGWGEAPSSLLAKHPSSRVEQFHPCSRILRHLSNPEPLALFSNNVISSKQIQISLREVQSRMGLDRTITLVQLETASGKKFRESEIFLDGNADLIIGISTDGATKGHMYISVRGNSGETYRFDGRLFWKSPNIVVDDWHLNNGLILRYKNIPVENRNKMIEFLKSAMNGGEIIRAGTCIAAGCELIYLIAQLGGMEPRKRPYFPSTFLGDLARHHLIAQDGSVLLPEIYTLNSEYQIFWNNLPTWWRAGKFLLPLLLPKNWQFGSYKTSTDTDKK